MRVPNMNAGRARGLFRAGIRDAQSLAVADQAAVEKALAGCISAQMKSRGSAAGGSKQQVGALGWVHHALLALAG